MTTMFDWNETYRTLISFGLAEADATHYTSVLSKWNTLNLCPDIEVRSYLRRMFHYLNTPHERRWNGLSYEATFFLWQSFAKVWHYRQTVPRWRRRK